VIRVADRRHSLFGHICRLPENTMTMMNLWQEMNSEHVNINTYSLNRDR